MASKKNSLEAEIKREATRSYKENFGKGPDKTTVRVFDNIVAIKFEGALTTLEEKLINEKDGSKLVLEIRDTLLKKYVRDGMPIGFSEYISAKYESTCHYLSQEKNILYTFLIFQDTVV
ncbi:MAG: Na-translocating system protein MpsC family protein [Lutisporaceae bacterium]|jgi:uncharacterized protein YbcI